MKRYVAVLSILFSMVSANSFTKHVNKAVIPAAGLGTRFLPVSKSVPKEMIPILGKPTIQYVIEEGLRSGIENYIMITSRYKHALENYFDYDKEIDLTLKEANKTDLVASIDNILEHANFISVRQPKPLGLGHAVLMAQHCIGKEYFAIFLPDDFFDAQVNVLDDMIRISKKYNASVIAVEAVPEDKVSSYGVVAIKKQLEPGVYELSDLVEKPKREDAPSDLAIIGRYILSHKIFDSLQEIPTGANGEIQLTDGIRHMMQQGETLIAYQVRGLRYDAGTPFGWFKSVVDIVLKDPDYKKQARAYLLDLLSHNKTD